MIAIIEKRRFMEVSIELAQDSRRGVITRLYHDRKYIKKRLGIAEWKSATDEERTIAYEALNSLYNNVKQIYSYNGKFTADMLKQTASLTRYFNDYVQERINKYLDNNQISTAKHYTYALKQFNKQFGKVKVDELTSQHFIDYKKDMLSNGYSNASINIYLSDMKAVCNYLKYKKILTEDTFPFRQCIYDTDKVSIPQSDKRSEWYLDKEDIKKLYEYYIISKDKYLAIWLFSYLCGGVNVADILNIKTDRHWIKTNGTEFVYYRQKTIGKNNFPVIVPITKWLEPIIGHIEIKEGIKFFPYLAENLTPERRSKEIININNHVSRRVRKIAKMLSISDADKVSTTFARHSFATIMNREEIPYNFIEYMMAHANGGVSSHYIGRYTHEQAKGWLEKLI